MRSSSWAVVGTAALGTAIATWFALAVPLGLPYDEPAHWANVVLYATQHRMPVLGDPGVPYEAQMGPVYYVLAALVVAVVGGPEHPHAATILRLAGVLLVPVLVALTHRIGRALSADGRVAPTAAAVVATTPLLVMVGGSIQNDFLCFVLIALALLTGIRLLRRQDARPTGHLILGVVVGVAVLTKVVALALVPALALAYVAHRAPLRRRLGWAAAAAVGVVVTAGWWFVRNLVLYGDLTSASAMSRLGISFPPQRWHGLGDAVAWFGNVVSYTYIPVEYYRNLLPAPTPLRVVAPVLAVVTVAVLVGQLIRRRGVARTWVTDDPARLYACATVVCAVVGWVVFSFAVFNGAPRLAFHAAPVVAVLFAMATRRRPWAFLAAATVVVFLASDAYLAVNAPTVTGYPFLFG